MRPLDELVARSRENNSKALKHPDSSSHIPALKFVQTVVQSACKKMICRYPTVKFSAELSC